MSTSCQRPGDWKVVCDFSGMTFWASEMVTDARGYKVHRNFIGSEAQRHPQETPYRPPHGESRVPWARPEGTAQFRDPTDVTAADL
jgi:hypothetical protein